MLQIAYKQLNINILQFSLVWVAYDDTISKLLSSRFVDVQYNLSVRQMTTSKSHFTHWDIVSAKFIRTLLDAHGALPVRYHYLLLKVLFVVPNDNASQYAISKLSSYND